MLSANISIDDLLLIYNWETAILFAVVIFVVRPLGVFLSTTNSDLNTNEKLFISWVGPRGIVAAGIASLFGTKLVEMGVPGAQYITPLVFGLVLVTVLLNATTARMVASLLGVFLKKSEGIMIIGGSRVSRLIAAYLQKNNRRVVLIDSNKANVEKAKELGIDALSADIYNDDLSDNIELSDMGYLLSMTGNDVINRYAMDKLGKDFGENGTYRLISSEELRSKKTKTSDLFCSTHDYLELMRVAQAFPSIQEVQASSPEIYKDMIELINNNQDAIALFVKNPQGVISLVGSTKDSAIEEKTIIAYIGRPMDFEDVMTAKTPQSPLKE